MLEPLPQGMHDHRMSFAESEAQRDWPSKPTEDSVATQSPTCSWIRRRGSLAPVHGGIDRPAPPVVVDSHPPRRPVPPFAHLSSPNSQTCPSFKVNFHPISKSLKLLHSWKSRPSNLPTLLTTAQVRISITFPKSSSAFSYSVTSHSSHLLPYSTHTSRHTAKTTQQKLQVLL